MASQPRRNRRASGFTLLEVLISIGLFAIVISSVYGAYQATFTTVQATESQVIQAAAARVILERISEDLAAISTDESGFLQGRQGMVGDSRADSLSCMSFAHLAFNRADRQLGRTILKYSVEETDSNRIDLYRSDLPVTPGTEGETETDTELGELLGTGLQEFRLTYVTADGTEHEEWDSSQDGTGAGGQETGPLSLPVLIRIEIRLADSPDSEDGTTFRTAVALPSIPAGEAEG